MQGYIVKDKITKKIKAKFQGASQTAESIMTHNKFDKDKYFCVMFPIEDGFSVNDYDESSLVLFDDANDKLKNKLNSIYFRENQLMIKILLNEINELRNLMSLPKKNNTSIMDFIKSESD